MSPARYRTAPLRVVVKKHTSLRGDCQTVAMPWFEQGSQLYESCVRCRLYHTAMSLSDKLTYPADPVVPGTSGMQEYPDTFNQVRDYRKHRELQSHLCLLHRAVRKRVRNACQFF
jgi:hypothetical protein